MEDNNNLNVIDESLSEIDPTDMSQEELKQKIGDFLTQERGKSMILGYRVCCRTVLEMIAPWHQKNCSHREYERIFKKVEEFCGKALRQDENDTEASTDETVQN